MVLQIDQIIINYLQNDQFWDELIINSDWRTVYKTYYLPAVINFDYGNITKAKYYNKLSLRAYPYYSLALNLNKQL